MNKLRQIFLTASMVMMISSVFAADYYSIANGDWNSNSTWSTAGFGGAAAASYPGSSDNVFIGDGFTVTVTANEECNNMTFDASTVGEIFINASQLLEINGVTQLHGDATTQSYMRGTGHVWFKGTVNVNSATGGNYNGGAGGGGFQIRCDVALTSPISMFVGGGTNTTCKLIITGQVQGSGGIIKAGTPTTGPGLGQLELWSNSSYSGATTINAGTVEIRAINALGVPTTGTTVNAGGELIMVPNVSFGPEPLTLNGGILSANDGVNDWNGPVTLTGATMSTIRLVENGTFLGLDDAVTIGAGCTLLYDGTTDGEIHIDADHTGSGSIRKTGPGMVLTLQGPGTSNYSGGTDLREGQIHIYNASAFGTGAVTMNQQTAGNPIKIDNRSGGFLSVANAINWNSPFAFMGSNNLTLTGNVTLGAASLGRIVNTENPDLTKWLAMSGLVSGSFANAWTKTGPGRLDIGNDNNFDGTSTILDGWVRTLHRKAFGKSTNDLILTKGTLELATNTSTVNYDVVVNGTAFTIVSNRATAGAGVPHGLFDLTIGNATLTITGGNMVTGGNSWVIFSRDVTYTGSPTFLATNGPGGTAKLAIGALNNGGFTAFFTGNGEVEQKGIWSGTGGVFITDGGSLRLDSANTYSGETRLNSGHLILNNNNALGAASGLFTVNGGQITNSRGGSVNITKNLVKLNGNFTYKGFTVGTPETLELIATVTMNGDRTINVAAGALAFNGSINTVGQFHNLTKTGTGTLDLEASDAYFDDVTISTGTVIAPNASGSMLVYGNFANNATFTHNSGKVTFKNASSKTISATGALNFWNVLKSGEGTNVVNCAMNVGGDMKFFNGTITIGTGSLNFLDGSTTSFGNNNSHVIGSVNKIGNDGFVFPTGDAGMSARIAISAPSNVNDIFTARYYATSHGNTGSLGSGVNNVSIKEYWNLVQTAGSSTVGVELFFDDATFSGVQLVSTSDLFVASYQGGSWIKYGGAEGIAGSVANGGSVAKIGFSAFGDFTFGSKNGDNGLGAFIPGMIDAVVYEGATTSGEFNGQEAAANLKDNNTLNNNNIVGSINVYPNPSTGLVNISYPKGANVTSVVITNISGAQVFVAEGMVNQIDLSELATGMYMVQINASEASTVKRLVIKK